MSLRLPHYIILAIPIQKYVAVGLRFAAPQPKLWENVLKKLRAKGAQDFFTVQM